MIQYTVWIFFFCLHRFSLAVSKTCTFGLNSSILFSNTWQSDIITSFKENLPKFVQPDSSPFFLFSCLVNFPKCPHSPGFVRFGKRSLKIKKAHGASPPSRNQKIGGAQNTLFEASNSPALVGNPVVRMTCASQNNILRFFFNILGQLFCSNSQPKEYLSLHR